MRLGIVDFSALSETEPTAAPRFPSPTLLRAAAAAGAESVLYLEPSSLDARLPIDRLLAIVPPWCRALAAPLLERCGVSAEIHDPWCEPRSGSPAYDVVQRGSHGDVDLAPHRWPVHPWVAPSVAGGVDPDAGARAAFGGLAALHTTRLVLADERARLGMDRVRSIAELVSASLKSRRSLVELALRVWPEDLRAERMIDHLSLLPVAGLDLLVGSLHDPSRTAMDSPLAADEVLAVIGRIAAAGLGPSTTLSIAVALPGESVHDSIASLDRTLRVAAEHRLAAVRCALWIGAGGPPADREDQRRRFLETHPSWTEEEYRGYHDLVAVIRQVAPNIEVVGPGFLASWDSVP